MRIRFTLELTRTPKPEPASDEPPSIYDVSGASTERAGYQRMGFTADHNIPDDYEDRS